MDGGRKLGREKVREGEREEGSGNRKITENKKIGRVEYKHFKSKQNQFSSRRRTLLTKSKLFKKKIIYL